MRAAVMYGQGDLRLEEVPAPEPGRGELMVRVTAAGICGTDFAEFSYGPKLSSIDQAHPVTGHIGPMIPGHEFGGRVVNVGPGVDNLSPGDLIASGAGVSCGRCASCLSGSTNRCAKYWTVGLNRHGALAEFVTVPASCCLEVASLGLDETMVSLPQPMAIAMHAMRRGHPEPGAAVTVIGAGGIGTFLIYALLAAGHPVTVIDIDPAKLAIPAALGARTITNPVDLQKAPVTYEASGTPSGLRTALEGTAPGGRTVAVGLQKSEATLDLHDLSITERELVGTNAHRFGEDFETAARLIGERVGDWSDFMGTPRPLEDLTAVVLPAMADGSSTQIKYVFDPRL